MNIMEHVQTKQTVVDLLRAVFPSLAGSYGVRRIALFGSFAKGTPQPESDVDLLVELDRPLGLRFVDMADFLEETLGRKVDILIPDGLADIRVPHITKTITETMEYVCPA
jgi:predicted nucleotidyltransferase